jgi:signal peptide peptidase SppA
VTYAHLLTRIFDVPLAIQQSKLDAILGGIGDRLGLDITEEQIEAAAKSPKTQAKGYAVQDGVAIIPVFGTLMKKTSGLMAKSGSSSYETIGAQYQDAMTNPTIKGILMDIDSPGGETSGLFELTDLMQKYKGEKPVYATTDGAYSAAYAIACVADKIFMTRTAGVGSIGVRICHVDESQADQKAGLKYTYIFSGDKKVDGNSHEPLSSRAAQTMQAETDRIYQMFVSLVATNRNLSIDQVKGTEAGIFFGPNACPLFADAIGTDLDAFNALSTAINAHSRVTNLNKYSADGQPLKAELEEIKPMVKTDIDELLALDAAKAEDETEVVAAKADPACDDEEAKAKKPDTDPDEDDDDEDDDEDSDDDGEDDKKEDAKKAKSKTKAKSKADSDVMQIVNLCAIAGIPHLTATFISNGYTAAEVSKAIMKQRSTKTKNVKIASTTATAAANDFASVASQVVNDKNIPAEKKADAYRAYLLGHKAEYLATMQKRKRGQNYEHITD